MFGSRNASNHKHECCLKHLSCYNEKEKSFKSFLLSFLNCKWERESLLSESDSLHVGNLGIREPYGRNVPIERANKPTSKMGREELEQVQIFKVSVSSCCWGSTAPSLHPVTGVRCALLPNICLFLSDFLYFQIRVPTLIIASLCPKNSMLCRFYEMCNKHLWISLKAEVNIA